MIPLIDKNGQLVNLSLEKALYVCKYFNLLSVDNLVSAGNKVTFEPSKSQLSSKNIVLELFREEKSFYLQESIQRANFSLISLGQWHCRLGHLNTTTIEKMEKNEIVEGLKIGFKSKEFCETCVLNKSTNEVTNKEPREVSNTKMDLIFSDICGPFSESFHGMEYIISFIEDYTKFAKVYFMASKRQASEKLEEFLVFCKEDKPKEIRATQRNFLHRTPPTSWV